ncbi:MAG: hypothetical protein IPK54_10090 [Dokdonella sp.]|uniref:hypothetical protein n=1 Tax=Dokdonella sp. TaxID=2291710 RepID=UPI0025C64F05|nr:hypothetical protein [Dokdonella sp.]MBK8123881.1 hypothetical protein [Dokdonella sp.]
MKLYPAYVLLSPQRKPLMDGKTEVTVRALVAQLLDVQEGKPLSGEAKMERFKLQQRLYEPNAMEEGITLTATEVTLLMQVLEKTPLVTPNIYGQIVTMLEQK